MRRVISAPGARGTSTSPGARSAAARTGGATPTAAVAPPAASPATTSSASTDDVEARPATWGDCLREGWGEDGPCPWVGCRHHLLLEIRDSTSNGEGIVLLTPRGRMGGPNVLRPATEEAAAELAERAVEALEAMTTTCSVRVGIATKRSGELLSLTKLSRLLVMTRWGASKAVTKAKREAEARGIDIDRPHPTT